jgi:hypothetical protein
MMMQGDAYYAAAHWGARAEPPSECALRWSGLLGELAQVDPVFSKWFVVSTRQPVGRSVAVDQLEHNHADVGGAPIVDLGVSLSLWNGSQDTTACKVRGTCGCYHPRVNNVCMLSLPRPGDARQRLLGEDKRLKIVLAMAHAWEPDWVVVSTDQGRAMARVGTSAPYAGLTTYVSNPGGFGPLPAAAQDFSSLVPGHQLVSIPSATQDWMSMAAELTTVLFNT